MPPSLPPAFPDARRPSVWLTGHADLLPPTGDALDVACGRGRHALWLARRGLRTRALDRDTAALEALREAAARQGVPVLAEVADLERGAPPWAAEAYDVIVVIHYLHRPLLPALLGGLRPGGVLVYETFTREQARRGKPTNPDFLLEAGELRRLVAPLELLDAREGEFEGAMLASVIARRR